MSDLIWVPFKRTVQRIATSAPDNRCHTMSSQLTHNWHAIEWTKWIADWNKQYFLPQIYCLRKLFYIIADRQSTLLNGEVEHRLPLMPTSGAPLLAVHIEASVVTLLEINRWERRVNRNHFGIFDNKPDICRQLHCFCINSKTCRTVDSCDWTQGNSWLPFPDYAFEVTNHWKCIQLCLFEHRLASIDTDFWLILVTKLINLLVEVVTAWMASMTISLHHCQPCLHISSISRMHVCPMLEISHEKLL